MSQKVRILTSQIELSNVTKTNFLMSQKVRFSMSQKLIILMPQKVRFLMS